MPRQSVLAGHIAPIIESFVLSKDDFHAVIQHVSATLSIIDLAVLFVFGWLLIPSLEIVHSFIKTFTKRDKNKEMKRSGSDVVENEFKRPYFFVVDNLSQIARLSLVVYACDCMVREVYFDI